MGEMNKMERPKTLFAVRLEKDRAIAIRQCIQLFCIMLGLGLILGAIAGIKYFTCDEKLPVWECVVGHKALD